MIPKRIWIEMLDEGENDSCDVIVEMEDGNLFTAAFITLAYLRRQMDLCYHVCKQVPDATPMHYAAMETPHIVVEDLGRETIEDIVDSLIAMDTFDGVFTLVTEEEDANGRTTNHGKRATTEVAAVVMNEVLTVRGEE
jgi:hypothetical protein